MNLKLYLSSFVILLCIHGFGQKFNLTGRFLEHYKDGTKIILISSGKAIHETTIKNDSFAFAIENEFWDFYMLDARYAKANCIVPVFLNSHSKTHVIIEKDFCSFQFSGDKLSLEQNEFYRNLQESTKKWQEASSLLASSSDLQKKDSLQTVLKTLESNFNLYYTKWVINHPASPFSANVIRLCIYKPNSEEAINSSIQLYQVLKDSAKLNNLEANSLSFLFSFADKKYATILENMAAPDFKIKDTSGNVISLANFNNQYLLLDFWASWCKPCRSSNHFMSYLHEKYTSSGLTILSISMDTDEKLWKNAIIKDDLTWSQGSDLKGQFNDGDGVGRSYNIGAVPYFVLLSKEHKVLYTSIGLNESELEKIIQTHLKNNIK